MQTVTIGDLTPDPALWHEDSGRKPWENRRYSDFPYNVIGVLCPIYCLLSSFVVCK